MHLLKRISCAALALMILTAAGCSGKAPASQVILNVSAASSLSNALNEINRAYALINPGVTVVPNYGGSGTLQTQIENGAPCDVFLSAASAQMDNLQNKGLLFPNSRRNLLNNHLALVVPKGSTLGITGFSDLAQPRVKLIAIGDPASVPAGAYARLAFTELDILDELQPKFILGASAAQVLQYVGSSNVDAGIVYSTDALADPGVTMVAVGSTSIDAAIVYPVAIIKTSKMASAAWDYVDFLSSLQAKAVFEKYGFTLAAK